MVAQPATRARHARRALISLWTSEVTQATEPQSPLPPCSSPLYTLLAGGDLPPNAQQLSGRISRALLPLEDAYAAMPPPWGPPLRSSYRNGRILDYIWTSPAVTVLRTMPVCNAAGSAHPHRIPSLDHPSDHMPIGVRAPEPVPLDHADRCAHRKPVPRASSPSRVGTAASNRSAGFTNSEANAYPCQAQRTGRTLDKSHPLCRRCAIVMARGAARGEWAEAGLAATIRRERH